MRGGRPRDVRSVAEVLVARKRDGRRRETREDFFLVRSRRSRGELNRRAFRVEKHAHVFGAHRVVFAVFGSAELGRRTRRVDRSDAVDPGALDRDDRRRAQRRRVGDDDGERVVVADGVCFSRDPKPERALRRQRRPSGSQERIARVHQHEPRRDPDGDLRGGRDIAPRVVHGEGVAGAREKRDVVGSRIRKLERFLFVALERDRRRRANHSPRRLLSSLRDREIVLRDVRGTRPGDGVVVQTQEPVAPRRAGVAPRRGERLICLSFVLIG